MSGKAKKAISIITWVIVGVFMLFAVFAVITTVIYRAKGEDAVIFGKQFRIVVSGSMEPEIRTGELVVIDVAEKGDEQFYSSLEVGDILTFLWASEGENVVVTHRIIDISSDEYGYVYTLKGDAVENDTQRVTSYGGEVIGKVTWHSLGAGRIMTFLRSPVGIVCCLIVPAAIIMVYEVIKLAGLLRAGRAEKAAAANAAREEELESLRREIEELRGKAASNEESVDKEQ